MKKRPTPKDKATAVRHKAVGSVEGITRQADQDIEAAQQKWSSSYAAAAYIVGLEKQIRFIQDACSDLYHLVLPENALAKSLKRRARLSEEQLCHADGHRHRRGYVGFHEPES